MYQYQFNLSMKRVIALGTDTHKFLAWVKTSRWWRASLSKASNSLDVNGYSEMITVPQLRSHILELTLKTSGNLLINLTNGKHRSLATERWRNVTSHQFITNQEKRFKIWVNREDNASLIEMNFIKIYQNQIKWQF